MYIEAIQALWKMAAFISYNQRMRFDLWSRNAIIKLLHDFL